MTPGSIRRHSDFYTAQAGPQSGLEDFSCFWNKQGLSSVDYWIAKLNSLHYIFLSSLGQTRSQQIIQDDWDWYWWYFQIHAFVEKEKVSIGVFHILLSNIISSIMTENIRFQRGDSLYNSYEWKWVPAIWDCDIESSTNLESPTNRCINSRQLFQHVSFQKIASNPLNSYEKLVYFANKKNKDFRFFHNINHKKP